MEEGAIPPLFRLLKDGGGTTEVQIATTNALVSLVDDMEKTRIVSSLLGVLLIVPVMRDSSMSVQTAVAELVAKMAEVDQKAREEFGRENILKPLVSSMMIDLVLKDINPAQRELTNMMGREKEREMKNTTHTSSNVTSDIKNIMGKGKRRGMKNIAHTSSNVTLGDQNNMQSQSHTQEGIGTLSVPYALSQGGWLSLILLFTVTFVCSYIGILHHCMLSNSQAKTYPDIGNLAFGYKERIRAIFSSS